MPRKTGKRKNFRGEEVNLAQILCELQGGSGSSSGSGSGG